MQFKALALLFASVALAQSGSYYTQVTIRLDGTDNESVTRDGYCHFFPDDNIPVENIDITPLMGNHPTCTFYTDRDCEGQDYSLKEGNHPFSRPFFVGSFRCQS